VFAETGVSRRDLEAAIGILDGMRARLGDEGVSADR
jgi:hypothetical protein